MKKGKETYRLPERWVWTTIGEIGVVQSGGTPYVYYYFQTLKPKAEKVASGTTFLELSATKFSQLPFPLAPLQEQKRIVSKIESLFSELDQAEIGLQKAKQQLEVYRQALLKSAFEGKLTEQWRKENNSESIEKLQNSINKMRKEQFEEELAYWKLEIDKWNKNGKKDKKPIKPKEPYTAPLISNKELKDLADIPSKWKWVKTSSRPKFAKELFFAFALCGNINAYWYF